jgi:Amt family ammonium transporter
MLWLIFPILTTMSSAAAAQDAEVAEEVAAAVEEVAPVLLPDSGHTAWMLISTALVMLMVPGLALFYGGMVRRQNVLSTMMHSMVALAIMGVQWVIIGYCIAFGESHSGLFGWSSDLLFLRGIGFNDLDSSGSYPLLVFVMFQGMFAIITPALISGAVAERIKFGPYCLFILLWGTLIYDPLCHWVWGGGWLGAKGALDFAGGTVVHISAGVSALALVLFIIKPRHGYPNSVINPNSMVLTLTGAGLLWFGWFGFNGGSALASNAGAAQAFATTQIAAATAGLVWILIEWLHHGKPTVLGIASGIVAGLVAITPAAGFVSPGAALAFGLIAGAGCYIGVMIKTKLGFDDSLDAFGVHGVGGALGAIAVGIFAAEAWGGKTGLLEGNGEQLWIQVIGVGASALYCFVGTIIIAFVVSKVCGGFRIVEGDEAVGLDSTQHGEAGYHIGEPGLVG